MRREQENGDLEIRVRQIEKSLAHLNLLFAYFIYYLIFNFKCKMATKGDCTGRGQNIIRCEPSSPTPSAFSTEVVVAIILLRLK